MFRSIAIALLFALAPMARADTITTPNGYTVTIPNGSIVTSTSDPLPAGSIVDFSFLDGSGSVSIFPGIGTSGQINFTIPVSNLNLTGFLGPGEAGLFATSPTGLVDPIGFGEFISGPVSEIFFESQGQAGIESTSYTVPEPSTLLLLSLGLVAFPWIRR